MANTVYGPYSPTSWVNGTTAVNATHMNNIENQSSYALHGYNPDLIGAGYVHSGCAASGSVGTTTVNIASGRAYVLMTDGTVGCIVVGSTTQTTSTPSSTYHLYLQPDGTFYWSTSNSPQSNSLALATVATNGSGQISSITDARNLNPALLPGLAGIVSVPGGLYFGPASGVTSTPSNTTGLLHVAPGASNYARLLPPSSGASHIGVIIGTYNGSTINNTVNVGNANPATCPFWINESGAVSEVGGQASAGSYGVPVIVARTIEQSITNTTKTTIATWTAPSSGSDSLIRIWARCYVGSGNTNNGTISLTFTVTDPQLGSGPGTFIQTGTTTAISGVTGTKGTPTNGYATQIPVASGGSITLSYQNTAAGTISDLCWATIEVLA